MKFTLRSDIIPYLEFWSVKAGIQYSLHITEDTDSCRHHEFKAGLERSRDEFYLMNRGKMVLRYCDNSKVVNLGAAYRRNYLELTVEDLQFFGDIDFLLNDKENHFEGRFTQDSSFWVIPTSLGSKVLSLS